MLSRPVVCAWPRKEGELSITSKESGVQFVVAPKGAPVSSVYRHGHHQLLLGETPKTQESLGNAFAGWVWVWLFMFTN